MLNDVELKCFVCFYKMKKYKFSTRKEKRNAL